MNEALPPIARYKIGYHADELQDLVALSAQAPNQPGGFSSGDMASAAAQGYRQGYEQRDAEVRGALV